MIVTTHGDMFASHADALVIPVNCTGVMGAGVARICRDRYYHTSLHYQRAARHGDLKPGGILICSAAADGVPERSLIFAATKDRWQEPSQLEWIESIAARLAHITTTLPYFRTMAIPALGAGHGGLDWTRVRAIIHRHLAPVNSCTFHLYPPKGWTV